MHTKRVWKVQMWKLRPPIDSHLLCKGKAFFYPHGHNWGQMWGQSVRWVQVQKVSYPLASYLRCKGKILPLGKQLRAHRDKGCPLQSGASSLWWGSLGWWLTGWGLPGWGKRLRSPSLQSQGHTNPSLDLRLSEWSSDFKGLGCQLPAWRLQEKEGAEKQAVWFLLISEDTSFWHQVPSYGKACILFIKLL